MAEGGWGWQVDGMKRKALKLSKKIQVPPHDLSCSHRFAPPSPSPPCSNSSGSASSTAFPTLPNLPPRQPSRPSLPEPCGAPRKKLLSPRLADLPPLPVAHSPP